MASFSIDGDYLVGTLTNLVRIDSVNPSLVPGGAGESRIAARVAEQLESLGLDVEILEATSGRPSVVGRLRGSGGGRSLMFNAHTDTVGIEAMADALAPTIRDGRLYGRGAYDMKGSLAACLAAVKALVDGKANLRGDVVVAAVADEEYASLGTAEVVRRVPVDAAIVTEPTELDLCVAHKGFVWLEVETLGKAAHGSRFFEGIDANMRMGRFLARLDRLEQDLRTRPPHPLVGPPSLHAPTLRGGSELSTYAASCRLGIERRTVPGETEPGVRAEIETLIEQTRAADSSFKATVRCLLARNAFEVSEKAAIVRAARDAATRCLGRTPAFIGKPFWMDSAILADAGVETVVIGPVGGGAHTSEEWVDLQSLEDLAEILSDAASAYCS
ncbi:MAG: M20/M25/M40 family metallo-hydrolase [Zetaproteobacteria bacterium]|nr:MAG: M20/M25/M40 family metallo-hydrolase [Zetaproteobacteria bacterium]